MKRLQLDLMIGMISVAAKFDDLEEQPIGALPPRDRILRTASDLFYRFSIHTVGIDRIIAESGVAKMTFYKHFPSKANLIAIYLRQKRDIWFDMLLAAANAPGLPPAERVLAVFDALGTSFGSPSFRGCPFVKGMTEFGPDADAPEIQTIISSYFESLQNLVAALIEPMRLADPEKALVQILSLIQGSIVMAQATSNPAIAAANRDAARLLLQVDCAAAPRPEERTEAE
ncbi:TetR/AcrR family transcriptional regulator [Sphingobium mellinum]|uniref:TetR/AcrR family transcriptional regulator n=1 Tax=Sphingobium mellinum TaxID=1387166 RepID=UPI0030EBA2FD